MKMMKKIIFMIIFNFHAISIAFAEENCTPWKSISEKFTAKKTNFTLAVSNIEAASISFLQKKKEDIYFKDSNSFEKISLEEALSSLKMQSLAFYFPLKNDECIKPGETIKKTINGLEFTIRQPYKGYYLSHLENNKKSISDAILEVE